MAPLLISHTEEGHLNRSTSATTSKQRQSGVIVPAIPRSLERKFQKPFVNGSRKDKPQEESSNGLQGDAPSVKPSASSRDNSSDGETGFARKGHVDNPVPSTDESVVSEG